MLKVIKTDLDYTNALQEIERLMDSSPNLGTGEADQLEILTVLVQDYENKNFQLSEPDPIEAIIFRMEQQNLTQRDLIPFIGSRSKVSEVLSRKRPLTLSMIRSLHNGLGIPAKSLLQEQDPIVLQDHKIEWDEFPIKEIFQKGWLDQYLKTTKDHTEALKRFFDELKPIPISQVMYRQSNHIRSARSMNQYALTAWTARVIYLAQKRKPKGKYVKGKIDADFMRGLARLSVFDNGPLLASQYLDEQGVSIVIERHLANTYLDGSAILTNNLEYPIIALTLRHDRIDNFWFTLMHELAHVCLHMDKGVGQFYDDLDIGNQGDLREDEADALASNTLVPEVEWRNSAASKLKSPDAVNQLANKLGVHPAIVAGRIRHKFKDYRMLNKIVGHNKIRSLFGVE